MRQSAQRTVVSAQQVLEALAQAYADFFHAPKDPTALLILLAQSAFETGWWRGMWNNNLGNYKSMPGPNKDWCFFKCWEMIPANHVSDEVRNNPLVTVEETPAADGRLKVWFSPDHSACCFASFPTLADGAAEYLTKLIRQYSDPSDQGPKDAWHWAVQGDVAKFTAALRLHGYYTADPAEYARGVQGAKAHLESLKLDFDNLPEWKAEEPIDQPIIHAMPSDDGNT